MAKESKNLGLSELKVQYKELQDKYNLPSFESMNVEFSIEKIADIETELLTKEIRRFIADKIFNYLRFIETILNPANAPMFIFSVIKSLSQDDKKKLNELYEKLSELDLELIKLDLESSEKKDAEFIVHAYNFWQSIKKELIPIFTKLKTATATRTKFQVGNILDNYPSTIVPINFFPLRRLSNCFILFPRI